MRTLTFIAIIAMSMWITDSANAQKKDAQTEGVPGQQQVEGQGQKNGKAKRKRGGNGQRGQDGQGRRRRGGMDQQQGQQRGRRGGAQMVDGLFKRFDKDTNGSISLEEAPDRMKQRFKTLDTNGDNSVSKEELNAAFEKMGQGRNGQQGKGGKASQGKGKAGAGKGNKGQGQGQARGQMMDPAKMIEQMDKNKDGVLSADEAPERMKKRFDRIDADSSGTVSANELKSAFEKMKNGKKGGQAGRDKSANPDATKPVKPKRPPMAKDGA